MVATAPAPAAPGHDGRFVALDSLRGLAALTVAAHHVHGGGPLFASTYVEHGALAVDFFFVLSGFVIAASYGARLSAGFPLSRFMALRLGRLYPLHLAVLGAYVALEAGQALLALPGMVLRQPFTGGHSARDLVETLFLVQAFREPAHSLWSVQSWSISVEVWLYLGFALLWRWLGARAWIAAVALIAAMGLLFMSDFWPGSGLPASAFMRGIVGFALGVCCWRLHQRHAPAMRPAAASLAEAASLALAVAMIAGLPPKGFELPFADFAFAAVVLVFAGDRGALSWLLARPAFAWLGVLSYSIYMVHGMVIGRLTDVLRLVGMAELVEQDGLHLRRIAIADPLGADLAGIAMLAVSVAVAWVTCRLIEAPARDWSRRRVAAMATKPN